MDNVKVLKGLVIWSVVALAILLFIPGLLIMFLLGRYSDTLIQDISRTPAPSETTNGTLGEKGSTCGGSSRLPCSPGLTCSVELNSPTTGVCQDGKSAAKNNVYRYELAEGASCLSVFDVCAAGLYCKNDPESEGPDGHCTKTTDKTPQIVQFKLAGAELAAGKYLAKPGTKLSLSVKTLNADKVEAYFIYNDTQKSGIEIKLKRGTGGQYTGEKEFTVEQGMDGTFEFFAYKTNDYSGAVAPFAASE
ncbi:MAG: hypothetical protein WC641_02425 [Patescibacteria group bacterium]